MSRVWLAALMVFPFTATSTPAQDRIAARGGVGTQKQDREVRTRFSPLVNAIATTIIPDSWEELGGPGSIVAIDHWGLLIVSQTEDIHRQVDNLIATIRRARFQQASVGDRSSGDPAALSGDDVARPVAMISESITSAANRKKIEQVLSSEAKLEFVDTPLSEVAEHIQGEFGIPVHVDKEALHDEGLVDEVPLTFQIPGITLRSALKIMLREVGLTYVIEEGVLLLTTPLRAESVLIERVYMVQDLAIPLDNRALRKGTKSRDQKQLPGLKSAPASGVQERRSEEPVTKVYAVADLVLVDATGISEPAHESRPRGDFDSLMNAISSTIQPASWENVGGPGSMAPMEATLSLVVRQAPAVHQEIQALLDSLREKKGTVEMGCPGQTSLKKTE